jgi:predicted sulfurtransferase
LKGGVARYLKEEGSSMWAGNLFVFDSRLSVPPEYYCDKEHEKVEENELKESDTGSEAQNLSAFARCQLCGDPLPEARHRNCANLDCNKLYLYVPFFISPNSAHCSLRPICKTFSLVI